ncbi:substrate-binding periplasmic protein [Zooshikella sp. RANM57]|uniref:substrate-binding periplasmic protein n=1 Tax=Zooshikella sp. RANM57 TaxID=3425863 RepID=UPI003D6F1BAF
MKSIICQLLLFICGCWAGISSSWAGDQKVVEIAIGEFHPWSVKGYKHGGFINHIITESFNHQGFQVLFIYHNSWDRNITDAEKGKVDASAFWACVDYRRLKFHCSEPLYTERVLLFHLRETSIPNWTTLQDLKPYKIGITRGYSYNKELWQAVDNKTLDIIVNKKDINNLNMLLRGRIDIFVTPYTSGHFLLVEHLAPDVAKRITYHPKPLIRYPVSLLFPKGKASSEKLLKTFNKGLHWLKKTGRYQRYYKDFLEGKYKGSA